MISGILSRALTLVRGKFASKSVETKILSSLARIGFSWLLVQVYLLLLGFISTKPHFSTQSLKASAHL
jgi:hypothetical protein